MSNAKNAESMSIISLTYFHYRIEVNKFGAQSGLGSARNTEGSFREGSGETGVIRKRFFNEVEQAEVMLGNHEKYHV